MNKVYYVIAGVNHTPYDHFCDVDKVFASKEDAEKRLEFLKATEFDTNYSIFERKIER